MSNIAVTSVPLVAEIPLILKSPPQKSAVVDSVMGLDDEFLYLTHRSALLELANPDGYLKAQYPLSPAVALVKPILLFI